MKHLVWGLLSMLLGIFFLASALLLNKLSVTSTLIYGALFGSYGIYRLKQYYEAKA